ASLPALKYSVIAPSIHLRCGLPYCGEPGTADCTAATNRVGFTSRERSEECVSRIGDQYSESRAGYFFIVRSTRLAHLRWVLRSFPTRSPSPLTLRHGESNSRSS